MANKPMRIGDLKDLSSGQWKEVTEFVNDEISGAIIKMGWEVYDISQNDVPVKTGRLKRSASFIRLGDGWEIMYDTPYAADVEFGRNQPRDDGSIQPSPPETHTVVSKAHKRTVTRGKNKGKKYAVKRHTKKFTNYRQPVAIGNGEFRTIDSSKKTDGTWFLTNSLDSVMTKYCTLTNGMQRLLSGKVFKTK